MNDINLMKMMENMQDIRLFSSLHVRQIKRVGAASSRELDILYRIIFSDKAPTPLELSELTGQSKSAVSRIIDNLVTKGFISKQYSAEDKRSYTLNITDKGNQELEKTIRYYLEPIYELRRVIGNERFESLITQIKEANNIFCNMR